LVVDAVKTSVMLPDDAEAFLGPVQRRARRRLVRDDRDPHEAGAVGEGDRRRVLLPRREAGDEALWIVAYSLPEATAMRTRLLTTPVTTGVSV
jgi:hypothetical protein